VKPADVFSETEIALIRRFTQELKMDWGGVDVLRNRQDGRIYIVDANKTDMGPPVILKLGEKLCATRQLARAFVDNLARDPVHSRKERS
jgi:phage terminase large subunit-like protein